MLQQVAKIIKEKEKNGHSYLMNVQKSPQIHKQSLIFSSDLQNTAKTVY